VQRWVLGGALVLVVGWLLYALREVLSPVFFAFLIAYMLDPVVDRIETFGVPRAAAITALLLVGFVGVFLGALLVLPALVRDTAELAREVPEAIRHLLNSAVPWLAERGVELPANADEALTLLEGQLSEIAPSAVGPLRAVLGGLLGGTASALAAAAGAVMVPILAFYLLYDFDRIVAAVRELVPHRLRDTVVSLTREVDEVLGQFVRGQVTVMLILAVLYAVAYSLLGVRLAVPIAITAGLLAFIPYVGGAVALGLALLMVALHFQGLGQLVAVVAAYGVIQVLEGFVITPRIVGDKLGLPPLWVLFALMVGGELFGFMGVMLALPASAVIKVFVVHGLARYRGSVLFLASGTPIPVRPPSPRLRLRTQRPRRRLRGRS